MVLRFSTTKIPKFSLKMTETNKNLLIFLQSSAIILLLYWVNSPYRAPNSIKEIVIFISRQYGKYILRNFIKGFKSRQKLMKGSVVWLRREPRNS